MISELSDGELLQELNAIYDSPFEDENRMNLFREARQRLQKPQQQLTQEREWLKTDGDVVRELLDIGDDLRASEFEIFKIALNWLAGNQSQLAAQTDRLLGAVRYTAMSTEDKFNCLIEARKFGLHLFVKPYVIEADWYRTCVEMNHPEFTDVVEFDRLTKFTGEGRRNQAIDEQVHTIRAELQGRPVAYSDGTPSRLRHLRSGESFVLDRVAKGTINAGTELERPRPGATSATQAGPLWQQDKPELKPGKTSELTGKNPRPSSTPPTPARARLSSGNADTWRNEMLAMAEKQGDRPQQYTLPMPAKQRQSEGSSKNRGMSPPSEKPGSDESDRKLPTRWWTPEW